jgi:hypothetical protein
VLEREPVWPALPGETPAKVVDLLKRCLQKDRNRRLHDIADARIELEEALAGVSRPRVGRKLRIVLASGVVAALALAVTLTKDSLRGSLIGAPSGRPASPETATLACRVTASVRPAAPGRPGGPDRPQGVAPVA